MRELDRIAVEETGSNLFQMMENAGRNLGLAAILMLGDDWRDTRVLVLAGSGGNGGGGNCAARRIGPDRCRELPLVVAASFQVPACSAES